MSKLTRFYVKKLHPVSNIGIRNKFELINFQKIRNHVIIKRFGSFEFGIFGFVLDFVLRISNLHILI